MAKVPRAVKVPAKKSPGEEQLAAHLDVRKIKYRRQVRLIPDRRWAWDFVVQDIAIEIHGGMWMRLKGAHSRGTGQQRDYEKQNAAVKAGYRVLVYSTEMVMRGDAINDVVEVLK